MHPGFQAPDELKLNEGPCYLWDTDRLRIVWANAAGLVPFGAETLFDLIDRPFDGSEPGVARIRGLVHELTPGEAQPVELLFPSAGTSIKGQARLEKLADGRNGILVIGDAGRDRREDAQIVDAFAALPVAAAIVDADGRLSRQNLAAGEFVDPSREATLASFLGDGEKAKGIIDRTRAAGTVSEIHGVDTKLGRREVRLTLRRTGTRGDAAVTLILTLEDVTERRALERTLAQSGKAPGMPQTYPARAASPLEETPTTKSAEPAKKASPANDMPAAVRAPDEESDVPPVIRKRLEEMDGAILILRLNQILHANGRALKLLGFASFAQLKARSDIPQLLVAPTTPTTIADAEGRAVTIKSMLSQVPWQGGYATQAIITAAAEAAAPKPETKPAPPADAAPNEAVVEAPAVREAKPQTAAREKPTAAAVEKPAPTAPIDRPDSAAQGWKPEDAELSAILDTASDGIITLDDQGRIRSFSGGAEAIFGTTKADVLGKPFTSLLTAETRKIFRDYLAALSDSGMAAVFNDGREVEAVAGPGKILPLFLTITRFQPTTKPKNGQKPGFCAVVRDITQWKQTELELREAKEKAERTSAQKSEFLARISHELRTPLNAILGFSEVMRLERFGRINNEKYRDYISDIHASGSHLLSLINDLLDLSKVEAGKLELNFTSVNLSEVTEHAIRLLADRAQQARVIMRKSFPPELPNVVADLRSMRQIMLNLLTNAIKFTDPGGQVIVSGRLNSAGELLLRVKDTGVGMTEEEIRGALEPFRRVTTDSRPDVEGTGLGLPLTRALTEANRAKFWISSEPGKGTLVEIVYPTTRVLAE